MKWETWIAELGKAATPGRLRIRGRRGEDGKGPWLNTRDGGFEAYSPIAGVSESDSALIVALHNSRVSLQELVEAARELAPFARAIEEHPTGWAFGSADDSVVYELMFRGQHFTLTVGMLRRVAAALDALDKHAGEGQDGD